MQWVQLYATPPYYQDPALARAGEAAEVLFCRALAYCGNNETRGRVDKSILPLIVAKSPAPRAVALVREGLWLDMGDHYLIRSWEKLQDRHDAAAVKRAQDRDRQREKRRRDAAMSQDAPPDNGATSDGRHADGHVTSRDGHAVDVEVDVEEQDRTTNKPSAKHAEPTRIDVETICNAVVAAEVWKGSKKPTVTDAWRKDARLMFDRDHRTLDEATAVLRWATKDDFWRAHITTVSKLRAKFDTLRLQMDKRSGSEPPVVNYPDADYADHWGNPA